MKKVTLVPDIYSQRENPGMYCNYARMKPYEERCLVCSNNCEHAGKHTAFIKNKQKKRVSVLGTLFIYLPNLGTFLGRYFRMTSLQVDCLNIPYHSACHYPVVLQRQMTSFSFCDV